jgi:hypothetical protein
LNNLVHKEGVPTVGSDSPLTSGNRFRAVPLSHKAIAFLKRALERNQHRRNVYRASRLRVCIDGEERVQSDIKGGLSKPFKVPLSASYIEVFGDDDDGELLLSMFPLHDPACVEADGGHQMFVPLEGGQTVTIEVALGRGTGGEADEYVIRLSYSQSAEVDIQEQ